MKSLLIPLVWATSLTLACANVAPTAVIQSAAMRPGTTLMDVVYRVNDPDDATVKVRALAFVDGERSFAKILKPVTFVEGTAAKLGDAIPSNTDHTLTWDVSADWNISLGQMKFEVLAMDGRGLLPFDWITIPAAGAQPALTISKDAPAGASILSALFWQYADGDAGLTLANGVLRGTAASGIFAGVDLANGAAIPAYGAPFVFKRMNLDPAEVSEISYAANDARAGLLSTEGWHTANRAYAGVAVLTGWGSNGANQLAFPAGLSGLTAISAGGSFCLALKSDGTVAGWGIGSPATPPSGLTGVTAIAVGGNHGLALKSDGTVVGWGSPTPATPPAGLTGVTAIAAGNNHSLARKSDGAVVGWGLGSAAIPPAGLSGVTAIAAGSSHSLALKSDGTVVGWGSGIGATTPPAGLSGVIAISAGVNSGLALKSDGTVVSWGINQPAVPAGLTGVTAIAVGYDFSVALKSDGTVVGWGNNTYGQITIPAGLTGVTAISASRFSSQGFVLALKSKGL